MWSDVVDLRDFYGGTLGRMARRMILREIREFWPETAGQRVLGLGYATPFLGPFAGEAERAVAVMPPSQGVLPWPPDQPGLVALGEETDLPFADLSMDRILLVHGLECSEQVRPLMREVWRVLSESGRLLVVVPNRRGLWSRLEATPFGHGRPYSPGQLSRLLRECLFTPLRTGGALILPPLRWRMLVSAAPAWERFGLRWFPAFSGVVLMEAAKQIYAPTPLRVERAPRRAVRLIAGPGGH